MALDPMLWAQKDAPLANVEEWAILQVMAESADEDGCNAFRSTPTIASRTMLHERTVQRRIDDMLSRGVIVRGDQRYEKLLRIPVHKRPTNYDLAIPFSWWGNIARLNEWRANEGRPPLTPKDRPDLGPAPAKKKRRDAGQPKERQDETQDAAEARGDLKSPLENGRGDYKSPPDFQSGGDSQTQRGDLQSIEGCQEVTQPSPIPTPEPTPEKHVDSDESPPAEPKRDEPGFRADVDRVCDRLAEWIERNGWAKPAIGKEWRREARLLMDKDLAQVPSSKTPEERVAAAIDWCQQDGFWRKNVLSMPKLREQFNRLRLEAEQARIGASGRGSNHVQVSQAQRDVYAEEAQRALA